MARIADGVNVLVLDEQGERVVLSGGDEVPSWASDQLGEHVLEAEKKPAPKRAAAEKSE
jgi:hypothetical protein